ncbi:MAG: GerW family sporulation protein, partial [Clostridia bacterium]|nr:GerW family sporulation protein [Clostridia bacterium]
MEKHPIQGLMETSMQSIREMVDVNTVLGDAIVVKDGSTVVPVSKVSFGFVAGGGEYGGKAPQEGYPFAGGAGAGVSLQPVGFLVCCEDHVRMLPAQSHTSLDRVIDMLPGVIEDIKKALKSKEETGGGGGG